MHENTIRNALNGLVNKRRLVALKKARGALSVYSHRFGNIVVSSKDENQAYLPEMSPISTDFLNLQTYKILYGKLPKDNDPDYNRLKALIEFCRFVGLKIKPEMILFQPKIPCMPTSFMMRLKRKALTILRWFAKFMNGMNTR